MTVVPIMRRLMIVLAMVLPGATAIADLAPPAPPAPSSTGESCIDDLLARFMPARVRRGLEVALVYRAEEFPLRVNETLDVWLPSRKLGRFRVTRVKRLWLHHGWVVEARVRLPRIVDERVALVALPGEPCAGTPDQEAPPFPATGTEAEDSRHLFDLDGDGRPDAFVLQSERLGVHSLFLLDRAAQRWVRSDLTDVS